MTLYCDAGADSKAKGFGAESGSSDQRVGSHRRTSSGNSTVRCIPLFQEFVDINSFTLILSVS